MRPFRLLTLLLMLSGSSGAFAQHFKVIAHTSVAVETITKSQLSSIFLKKQRKWSNGAATVPVDLPIDSTVRAAFSQAIHQKGASAVDAYWQKQIFSGRDVPPVTKSNDGDVIAFVRANAGAVGYVSGSAATGGVKVIEVVQ